MYNDDILSDQKVRSRASAPTLAARGRAACQKVQLGEVSRARQFLTGASVAQGNEEAFRAMQDRRPQEVMREILADVLNFQPETPVVLDQSIFLKSPQTARRSSSPGPGGYTYEHFKALMDDTAAFALFFGAASSFAQAKVPTEIAILLVSARLTTLVKEDGGARGIATGCTLRRLVARSLARQFSKDFEEECAPFK